MKLTMRFARIGIFLIAVIVGYGTKNFWTGVIVFSSAMWFLCSIDKWDRGMEIERQKENIRHQEFTENDLRQKLEFAKGG